jgi:hypothetical protein
LPFRHFTCKSPQAPVQLLGLLILVLQVLVFGLAAAALVATGHRTLALVFGVIAVINAILMYVWGQYVIAPMPTPYSPERLVVAFA